MTASILSGVSVRDFFRSALDNAFRDHSMTPAEATTSYLVDLLCGFLSFPIDQLDQPLGLEIAKVTSSSLPENRIDQLKKVGDISLYIVGFFRPNIRRRNLDLDYYNTIGGTAYRRLSVLTSRDRKKSQLTDVYGELSEEFSRIADVMSDVSLQSAPTNDVGQLYDMWLKTQSRAILHKLKSAGMVDIDKELKPKN